MSDDPSNPAGDGDRTVFRPTGDTPPAPQPPAADERTVFQAPSPPPSPASAHVPTQPPVVTQFAPRTDGRSIQVGDVLNHIFEVKRFIARGGMGEVFEGANVNSDERVAIKVMLPALAADPNVIGMFRKEARTLTRLNHEALVNYRVLAQEPQLGVLYIVTEYIDGTNLADMLGRVTPDAAQLLRMLRRLASGLRAAHALGAIHRDMSPDNVILEDADLDRGKIIDFGIAKDLDPGSATIVGEGFAGKLNYVAPEQLGDFGREVGPWTDVYSLALVIMAVALGRNVQMGGSLVDAVDKRRAGPDLSAMPDALRPVLAAMLRPDPKERLRSMDAVIAEIDAIDRPVLPPPPPPATSRAKIGAVIGLATVAAGAFVVFGMGRGGDQTVSGSNAPVTAAARNPVDVAREAINATLPSVACTWLDVARIENKGGAITVALTGVAGNPSAAQNEVGAALQGQKLNNATINFDEVAPITPSGCAALDTFRQIRAPDAGRLAVPQRNFEMRLQPPTSTSYPNKQAANALITMNIGDPAADFALIGLEPSGVITDLVTGRPAFVAYAKSVPQQVTDLGGDRYRLAFDLDHQGWSGMLLLTGKGPFPRELVAPALGARGPTWQNQFVTVAAERGWRANMVWFKSVDAVKE